MSDTNTLELYRQLRGNLMARIPDAEDRDASVLTVQVRLLTREIAALEAEESSQSALGGIQQALDND